MTTFKERLNSLMIAFTIVGICIIISLGIKFIENKKVPCSFPDPQFSGAEPKDYHVTDCAIE